MSEKRRNVGPFEVLLGLGLLTLAIYLGWLGTLDLRLPSLLQGLRVAQGVSLLLLLALGLSFWPIPKDGPGAAGGVPLFTARKTSAHRQTAVVVLWVALLFPLASLLMLGGALKQASERGAGASMYNNKGKLLGTTSEQVDWRARACAISGAAFVLGLWSQRQWQGRFLWRLLSKKRSLEATTSAGSQALVHAFSKGGRHVSFSGETIDIQAGDRPMQLQTEGALFASTWRKTAEGELLEQRLPGEARLLVAGAVQGGQITAAAGQPVVIFACEARRDPRAILRAVQARLCVLLALGVAGLVLAGFALG